MTSGAPGADEAFKSTWAVQAIIVSIADTASGFQSIPGAF